MSEARIDYGQGYRLYFLRRGDILLILLCGGTKQSQKADIATAKSMAKEFRMETEITKFDVQDYLKNDEGQIGYLEAVLEDGDPTLIAAALGDIARARGVAEFAKQSGLSREAIYKGFRPGGNPTLDTMNKAMKVLGLRLALASTRIASR